jgi:hypothetical protein
MIAFLAAAVALVGLGALAYWRWAKGVEAEIAEGADVEWTRLQAGDAELVAGLDRAGFGAIYRRVHFPRFPGYALAAAAGFVASLPLTFALLGAGALLLDRFGLAPNSLGIADRFLVEDGRMRFIKEAPPEAAAYWIEDVARFYYLFGVALAWFLVVAIVMRRYHARRPGYLRDELLRRK